MVDLSQNSLNFLANILSQVKAIYEVISNEIRDLGEVRSSGQNSGAEDLLQSTPSETEARQDTNRLSKNQIEELDGEHVRLRHDLEQDRKVIVPEAESDRTLGPREELETDFKLARIDSLRTHMVPDLRRSSGIGSRVEAIAHDNGAKIDAIDIGLPPLQTHSISRHMLKRYDRQDIYQKVWNMPLWQAAKQLGVKEHSLGNACIRLHIPTPPPGYWSRKEESRRHVTRPPLPKLAEVVVPPANTKPLKKPDEPPTISALLMSRYDREKLYEDVWRKPICRLAKEYGLSDAGPISRCKGLHIPTPGPNYWQRKSRNEPVPERPPLTPVIVTGFTTKIKKWDERKKQYARIHDFNKPRKSRRHPELNE